MTRFLFIALVGLCTMSCASTALLKQPIITACQSRGIKGCDELTDGVIAVVGGSKEDKQWGETKIVSVVQKNEPKQIAMFADAIDKIATQFGVDGLKPVIAILKGSPSTDVAKRTATLTNSKTNDIPQSTPKNTDLPLPCSSVEIQRVSVVPSQILVCSDNECSKYESIKSAIVCVDNKCDKWQLNLIPQHSLYSRDGDDVRSVGF